jgi:2-amino-4-hydroxy-6-hydroxymethyldihydropteridine diphosphokinase
MREGGELVFVAVGANLGDREATFAAVIRALESEADLLLVGASTVYETEPIGPGDQEPYLNAVIGLRSWLSPTALLACLQRIEARFGRDRSATAVRWGPRTLDLDLLFYGERVIELPELIVPHPRVHERAFVLMPLAELAPSLVHPLIGATIAAIAEGLVESADVRPWRRPEGWPGSEGDGGFAR